MPALLGATVIGFVVFALTSFYYRSEYIPKRSVLIVPDAPISIEDGSNAFPVQTVIMNDPTLIDKFVGEDNINEENAFGIKGGRDKSIEFMDSLKLATIATHVADAKTCLLHPASHTHRQLTEQQLLEAGVAPDLIRLSVGIENVEDLIDDLKQAFDKI